MGARMIDMFTTFLPHSCEYPEINAISKDLTIPVISFDGLQEKIFSYTIEISYVATSSSLRHPNRSAYADIHNPYLF